MESPIRDTGHETNDAQPTPIHLVVGWVLFESLRSFLFDTFNRTCVSTIVVEASPHCTFIHSRCVLFILFFVLAVRTLLTF